MPGPPSESLTTGDRGSLLFVRGGADVMRSVYAEHGMGYWSAAFEVLLEKHGWLDFDTAEPEILSEAAAVANYQALIVCWLPEQRWRQDYFKTLREFPGVLLLEGPLPAQLLELAGANSLAEGPAVQEGPLRFGADASRYIERRFGRSFFVGHREPDTEFIVGLGEDDNPLRLVPKRVVTKAPGVSRGEFADLAGQSMADGAGRAAVSLALAYRARFLRNLAVFEDPVLNALAVLFCVRCLAKLSDGSLRRTLSEAVSQMIAAREPSETLVAESTGPVAATAPLCHAW